MLQRVRVLCCLFAWLFASGSQWDFAQVFAWGRMFAGYSQEMSLSAAAQKTLFGEMCEICHLVQDGRKQQESTGDTMPLGKIANKMIDLCPLIVATRVYAPHREPVGTIVAVPGYSGLGRGTPPTPPPRV